MYFSKYGNICSSAHIGTRQRKNETIYSQRIQTDGYKYSPSDKDLTLNLVVSYPDNICKELLDPDLTRHEAALIRTETV